MVSFRTTFIAAAACGGAAAFSPSGRPSLNSRSTQVELHATSSIQDSFSAAATTLLSFTLLTTPLVTTPQSAFAEDPSQGASLAANSKITTGGASTLQSGRTIADEIAITDDKIAWYKEFNKRLREDIELKTRKLAQLNEENKRPRGIVEPARNVFDKALEE